MAAAETAVDLAAKLQAELLGLFVEDIDIFDLAVSPYARRILYPSAEEAPVSRATVESELKAQSEQARKVLATAADQSRVPWSFRTVRGEVVAEVLAAAGGADLLAMGRVGWSLGKQLRIGSAALEVVAAKSPVLPLSERCMPEDLRLLVCYDGSLPSKKRLLAAAHWASRGIDGLTVILSAAGAQAADQMKRDITELLSGKAIEVHYREIDPRDENSLLHTLQEEKSAILIVGERELLGQDQATLLQADLPLLLLGGDSELGAD